MYTCYIIYMIGIAVELSRTFLLVLLAHKRHQPDFGANLRNPSKIPPFFSHLISLEKALNASGTSSRCPSKMHNGSHLQRC